MKLSILIYFYLPFCLLSFHALIRFWLLLSVSVYVVLLSVSVYVGLLSVSVYVVLLSVSVYVVSVILLALFLIFIFVITVTGKVQKAPLGCILFSLRLLDS